LRLLNKYSRLVDLFKFFLLLTIIYALFIIYLSSQSDISPYVGFLKKQYFREFLDLFNVLELDIIDELSSIAYSNYDKILHFGLYVGFGTLLISDYVLFSRFFYTKICSSICFRYRCVICDL